MGLFARPGAAQSPPTDAGIASDLGTDAGVDAGGMTSPRLLHRVSPVYPAGADGRRVDVELLLTVDPTGHVSQAEVLGHIPPDAPASFDDAALTAARAAEFTPATSNGQPIAVRLRFHMAIAPPVAVMDAGAATATEPPETDEVGTGTEGITHAHPPEATDASAVSAPDVSADVPPSDAASEETTDASPTPEAPEGEATVHAHHTPESRGASDNFIEIGALAGVPHVNASDLLTLAPGILLTNEGGQGHAEQVYLRGFDAREGQDIEFTVNGIPFNDPGNPHGEGLSNTHFIIPELVSNLRVVEGPFDPHQGNYAVAGSAEYGLGLDERGLRLSYTGGSFNTQRALALWGPEDGRRGTFAGVDVESTDGYGSSRAAKYARAMGQYELALGQYTVLRIFAASFVSLYQSAGIISQADLDAGRIAGGFYGTEDTTQGGSESRHNFGITIEDDRPGRLARLQIYFKISNSRITEDYTGFLLDPPSAWNTNAAQRGDAVDQNYSDLTYGSRGSIRLRTTWRGLPQALEVGYSARIDTLTSEQQRLRFETDVPYQIDFDYNATLTNIGAYIDTDLRPLPWVTLRGGMRVDYFGYDVLDQCALHNMDLGSGLTPQVINMLCYDRDRSGPRDPTQHYSANALIPEPRGTLLVGPFEGVTVAGSVGEGSRSADPTYIGQGTFEPFSPVLAAEGGVIFNHTVGPTFLSARALYYYTHVGQDLIFNEQQGRNTLAPGTERQGFLAAARWTSHWFDWSSSLTYAYSVFDRTPNDPAAAYFPANQGNRVPYVPDWVFRTDVVVHGALPWRLRGSPLVARAGVGFTYVTPRSLPYNQWGDPLYLLDASVAVRWRFVEVGVIGRNLLDLQYKLAEYYYVSNFASGTTAPNMVPSRSFIAGEPLAIFGTLTFFFDSRSLAGAHP